VRERDDIIKYSFLFKKVIQKFVKKSFFYKMLKTLFCLFNRQKNTNMNYSKIQKFLSSLIIFSLLFGTTFRIPLLQYSTYASSKDFFSLVAVVVEEEIYSDIKSEVVRYSEDIQGVLENTRVVILPTP